MNAIIAAVDQVAGHICGTLEEIAKDDMFDTDMEIGDRLTQIKAALCLHKFLTDEDADTSILFPLVKDYDDDWGSDDYFTFAEAFVKFIDEVYVI